MEKPKGLVFHDQIIKSGKGESKFAVRYNMGYFSPMSPLKVKWDYNAKSVSCPIVDYSDLNQGIYGVALDCFFKNMNHNPYVKRIMNNDTWEPIKCILLEYTENDVLRKSDFEIALRQCNIVYVCDNIVSMYRMFKDITNKFQKIKEAAEYNTYY